FPRAHPDCAPALRNNSGIGSGQAPPSIPHQRDHMGLGTICPCRGPLPRLQARTWVEPVVASTQMATSLYDAGLLLVVKASFGVGVLSNHSASPSPPGALENQQQRAISNFYIIYNLMLYGAAALNGLCGGFSAFWSGVMALGSLGSLEGRRSLRLIVPESKAKPSKAVDTVSGTVGTYNTLDPDPTDMQSVVRHPSSPAKAKPKKTIIALLFVGAIIYDLAVVGTVDVIPLFVLREPLSWNQVQVGYGMAAGYTIFITSFLGVLVFSRYFQDTTMIIIGMVSFASGALLLAFVKETYMFYIGKVFVILQLSLALTGVVTSTLYNKIYQLTMEKFVGTCFALSSFLSCLAIIPIGHK
ncbi:hypothetical protein E2I00_012835, partial [Balaenoptera physalus]